MASRLLKTLLFIPLYAVCAASENAASDRMVKVGAQAQFHLLDIGYASKVSTTGNSDEGSESLAAMWNTSSHRLTDKGDRADSIGFGAGITARADIAEGVNVLARLSVEASLNDAYSYKLVGDPILLESDGIWSTKSVISPGIFVGYKGMYVGVCYDMREFDTPINDDDSIAELETLLTNLEPPKQSVTDNQVLFGFRGESEYMLENMSLIIGVEGMSNIGARSDSSVQEYFSSIVEASALYPGNATNKLIQQGIHSDITKFSVSIGFLFSSL